MEVMVESMIATDDMIYMDDMGYMGDMGYMDETMSGTQQVSKIDELMSSWIFVGGVSAAVLALGVLVGLLAAKRKIKKGMDLYED